MADIEIAYEISVASAGTVNLGAIAARYVAITGTTTITSFGTVANNEREIRFTGALTLTHNGTSLICPGAASIVTAAGDTALVRSDASGNWRVHRYTRGNGSVVATTVYASNGTDTAYFDYQGVHINRGVGYFVQRSVGGVLQWNGSVSTPNDTSLMRLTNAALYPNANGGLTLGLSSAGWGNSFFATGAVLNFGAGNYTITHSSGTLTFSGSASITGTANIAGAAGTSRELRFRTGTATRFGFSISSGAESGGDTGSNFGFARYDDAGAIIENVFSVTRSDGTLVLAPRNIQMGGGNTVIDSARGILFRSYLVASLPTPGTGGKAAWASNCRVFNGAGTQEGVGAGTGGLVTDNGSAWKIAGTNVTAVA